jgi:hypothetical protein
MLEEYWLDAQYHFRIGWHELGRLPPVRLRELAAAIDLIRAEARKGE